MAADMIDLDRMRDTNTIDHFLVPLLKKASVTEDVWLDYCQVLTDEGKIEHVHVACLNETSFFFCYAKKKPTTLAVPV